MQIRRVPLWNSFSLCQSGVTYAYEQTSSYDSERKQSRPVRKYLGRVDPETGEIIPTTGKRGRPPKKPAESRPESQEPDYKALFEEKCMEVESIQKELTKVKETNEQLSLQTRELKQVIVSIRDQIVSIKNL